MPKINNKKIRSGIEKYLFLRKMLFETNVANDRAFQKAYNGFFRMGRRTEEYAQDYYSYFEQHKTSGVNSYMKSTDGWKCRLSAKW